MDTKYEMIEYSKDLATSITGLSAYELDVLLTIAYTFKQDFRNSQPNINEDLKIEINPIDVKDILKRNGNPDNKRLDKAISNIFDTKFYFKKDGYTVVHHFFKKMMFTKNYKKIILVLDKEYIPLFFYLTGNFTRHSILIFNSLSGKYSKKIYQLIMSYKDLRSWKMLADEFRGFLEVTDKYSWANITSRCIKPAIKEILEKTDIVDIQIEKNRRYRQVHSVVITWKFKGDKEITEVEIVKEEIRNIQPLTETEILLFDTISTVFPDDFKKPQFPENSDIYILKIREQIKKYKEIKEMVKGE